MPAGGLDSSSLPGMTGGGTGTSGMGM